MCETKSGTNIKICNFGLATRLCLDEVVKVNAAIVEFTTSEIVDCNAVRFYKTYGLQMFLVMLCNMSLLFLEFKFVTFFDF